MDFKYCSLLARLEGEPIDGTAPEKDSAILLPASKPTWHRETTRDALKRISKNSDLSRAIAPLHRPLLVYYNPNDNTGEHIFVSNTHNITCFTKSGIRTDRKVKHLFAICTDGRKDACCAKFGIPIADSFHRHLLDSRSSVSVETSHIGGCRFASTAVCFPSGNAYGRISVNKVEEIVEREKKGLIVNDIFRGNLHVSEIQCWIMRYCMELFNFVPTISQTKVEVEKHILHVTISSNDGQYYSFDMFHREVTVGLFSGCANVGSGRTISRSVYDVYQ